MFRGKRKMTIQEAAQMAALLDVPAVDVLTNAGVQLPPLAKMVPMIGYVVENDQVALLGEANHELIEGPGELQNAAICVRCQYGHNEFMDGWILFAKRYEWSSRSCDRYPGDLRDQRRRIKGGQDQARLPTRPL
jgi:hypothetical protein